MKKILVVEDEIILRDNIKEMLEFHDFDVRTASNGQEALDSLKNFVPDLIICDIKMPVMDGLDFLNFVRHKPEYNKIQFIFLTAKAEKTDMREGMVRGADDYITKPFKVRELLDAVHVRLERIEQITSSTGQSDQAVLIAEADDVEKIALGLIDNLTKSEKYIVKCIAQGKSSQEIAEELKLSVRTVTNHRYHIGKKLKLHGGYSLLRFVAKFKPILVKIA